ncbi:hypothetical protein Q9291_07105 [Methylophilus aquaticus]|uniref:Uncharacterized protein n=1 Tax=Methylophilus aquaticus TaxID=1971610 RepID=A0ABT9JT06_9PROT|nr:hypothetical protein [Methylophilus aquaticus]MDP8567614.1 hypothetical protein [Methylophilus aquaticus]
MLVAVLAAGLPGCVTINIYFPAAAAEKAADKVIDEIWQLPPDQAAPVDHAVSPPASPAAVTPVNDSGSQPANRKE